MVGINMDDVINVLNLIRVHLIAIGVILVLGIIVMAAVRKMVKAKKYMIRWQAGIAMLLGIVIVVNMICFGPMSTLISLATGSGSLSEESTNAANELNKEVANEGIVLLDNEDQLLPLVTDSSLNVFGWASTNPCYGGTGSGALSDTYPIIGLLEGLEAAGFHTNTELSDFYTQYRADRPNVGLFEEDWTLPEPNISEYSDALIENAKEFSDTAMIVLTRVGGENADLPTDMTALMDGSYGTGTTTQTYDDSVNEGNDWDEGDHYLQLSNREEDLVQMVCENFEKVIVLYNGSNTIEMGWVNDYEQIKSVLWFAGAGQNGFNSLGNIMNGTVNPSGKTSDTFIADLSAAPYFHNIGSFFYDNMDEFAVDSAKVSFVNEVEGIYTGYRFYETAAEEGLIEYEESVVYPFGYGLSYTSFTQSMDNFSADENQITVDVTVTNTGSVAGKDVVELYYTPPYENGGIEKASVNLAAFDKTDLLEPGESQTLTLSFTIESMASYDTYGHGCYVLEEGEYVISLRSDSHTVIAEDIYEVDSDIVYDASNPRSVDRVAAVNTFDIEGDAIYLSREDGFANYAEATAAPASLTMREDLKEGFINISNYDTKDYNNEEDEMPVTGADNGLVLADFRGAEFDDPRWEQLLDQMEIAEMNELIAMAGYSTAAVPSIQKVSTVDCDGPAAINNNFTGVGSIGFVTAVVFACTWNEELSMAFGDAIGVMADEMDVSGWYAPCANMHRSSFEGRFFEYYSEDPLLTGKMAAQAVIGAQSHGIYAYMKHYALNEQECNRWSMICTWANEQGIREIYLKAFQIAIQEGNAGAVMSSYNYVGNRWSGGHYGLQTQVLRNEWGFNGLNLTDYFGGMGFMDSDIAIRNGSDACLITYDTGSNYLTDTESATSVLAMRNAARHILYTVVNSRAFSEENMNRGMEFWKMAFIGADVILAVLAVLLEITVVRNGYRKRKES